MRNLFATLTLFAWALWLGGLITLFMAVGTLFRNNHDLAIQAAPQLFHMFNIYQLIVGGIAIVLAILWRRIAVAGAISAMAALFILATSAAVVLPVMIVPPMNALAAQGQTHTPQFGKLHGESMMIYSAEVLLLALAGLLLPPAVRAPVGRIEINNLPD